MTCCCVADNVNLRLLAEKQVDGADPELYHRYDAEGLEGFSLAPGADPGTHEVTAPELWGLVAPGPEQSYSVASSSSTLPLSASMSFFASSRRFRYAARSFLLKNAVPRMRCMGMPDASPRARATTGCTVSAPASSGVAATSAAAGCASRWS